MEAIDVIHHHYELATDEQIRKLCLDLLADERSSDVLRSQARELLKMMGEK